MKNDEFFIDRIIFAGCIVIVVALGVIQWMGYISFLGFVGAGLSVAGWFFKRVIKRIRETWPTERQAPEAIALLEHVLSIIEILGVVAFVSDLFL